MEINLSNYSDEEINVLLSQISQEALHRNRVLQIPRNISDLTFEYVNNGGDISNIEAAILPQPEILNQFYPVDADAEDVGT